MGNSLKIIVPKNFEEFGKKVNNHVNLIKNTDHNYILSPDLIRFNNGEGKCILGESIRGKDTYILSDVSNYSVNYKCQTGTHYMSPDEHFMDILRIINATCCHTKKLTAILPYLYQSRQDKRTAKESLDLAMALNQLSFMGVKELVTADVHNKTACDNASLKMPIDNFYCSDDIILKLLENEQLVPSNLMVVAPDEGAFSRASFYSSILGGAPLGVFKKQRDYLNVKDGSNPITTHQFLSNADITGKDILVVDDMVATGGSIIDTAKQLKERGANKVFLVVTFGLFTLGSDMFDVGYKNKLFDKVYVTNLNYVPEKIKNSEWLCQVDCSSKVAEIICKLNNEDSIGDLLQSSDETITKIKKYIRK